MQSADASSTDPLHDSAATIPQPPTGDALLKEPSTAHWGIVALLMAYAVVCHFNRVSISVAGTERIIGDTISATQMGAVYSAYLLAYTLCMVPAGWLLDRRGARFALAAMGFASAVLAALTGCASVTPNLLFSLLVIRALLGAVSAPMHPSAARTVSFWFAYPLRPLANGLVTAAAVLGVASTYLVFGWLIDLFDWPRSFLISGVATGLLALGWSVYARDRPNDHRAIDSADRTLFEPSTASAGANCVIGPGAEPKATPLIGTLPERSPTSLLSNHRLWLLTASYGALGYFQYLFFYWQEYYFERVLELAKQPARLYASLPTLAMAAGMVLGGWLFARLERGKASRLRRVMLPALGLTVSGLFVLLGILRREPLWAVCTFSLAMAAAGVSEGSFWTTAVEIGGRDGGLSAAIMNTGGNAGGTLAPVVTPLLASYLGWQGGIGLASVLCVLGALFWFWIAPGPEFSPTAPHVSVNRR